MGNYSNFNMKEMDKFRELYSREGDNSIRFEGKTVLLEHTIPLMSFVQECYSWYSHTSCVTINWRKMYGNNLNIDVYL